MEEEQKKEHEIDTVDQILIADALRYYAEYSREKAKELQERGRNLIAQTRLMMADDAERLHDIIANSDRLVAS